jgi:hypothetical protein
MKRVLIKILISLNRLTILDSSQKKTCFYTEWMTKFLPSFKHSVIDNVCSKKIVRSNVLVEQEV